MSRRIILMNKRISTTLHVFLTHPSITSRLTGWLLQYEFCVESVRSCLNHTNVAHSIAAIPLVFVPPSIGRVLHTGWPDFIVLDYVDIRFASFNKAQDIIHTNRSACAL